MRELQIVEVKWLDAQTGFSRPEDLDIIIGEEPIYTKSVGYLMHKDKEKIILGFMRWDDQMFKHWQLIPMGMVRRIRILK